MTSAIAVVVVVVIGKVIRVTACVIGFDLDMDIGMHVVDGLDLSAVGGDGDGLCHRLVHFTVG